MRAILSVSRWIQVPCHVNGLIISRGVPGTSRRRASKGATYEAQSGWAWGSCPVPWARGASAVAMPRLHLAVVPALIALAAPLPPSPRNAASATAYYRDRFAGRKAFPGALRQVSLPRRPGTDHAPGRRPALGAHHRPRARPARRASCSRRLVVEIALKRGAYLPCLAVVATLVGLPYGLLTNSGGFLHPLVISPCFPCRSRTHSLRLWPSPSPAGYCRAEAAPATRAPPSSARQATPCRRRSPRAWSTPALLWWMFWPAHAVAGG